MFFNRGCAIDHKQIVDGVKDFLGTKCPRCAKLYLIKQIRFLGTQANQLGHIGNVLPRPGFLAPKYHRRMKLYLWVQLVVLDLPRQIWVWLVSNGPVNVCWTITGWLQSELVFLILPSPDLGRTSVNRQNLCFLACHRPIWVGLVPNDPVGGCRTITGWFWPGWCQMAQLVFVSLPSADFGQAGAKRLSLCLLDYHRPILVGLPQADFGPTGPTLSN